MKINLILKIVVSAMLMVSCTVEREIYKNVATLLSKEDLNQFKNKALLVRQQDKEGNFIIVISEDYEKAYDQRPVIITIDENKNKVLNVNAELSDNKLAQLKKLSITFIKYRINSLAVDNFDNVIVRIRPSDKPELARIANHEHFKNHYKINWLPLMENWYYAGND